MVSVVAIDLGGTAIKAGHFREDGTEIAVLTVPTPQPSTPEAVLAALVDLVARLDPQREAAAIGAGIPGLVDRSGRLVYACVNLAGWQNVPLADWLEKATGLPTVLGNDANLAGLGEVWLGSASRFRHVVFVTLGTGVGGGIVIDGEIFTGAHGLGAELGHMLFDPAGPPCPCGSSGCIEQFVAAPAIQRRFGASAGELGKRAAAGDPEALSVWQRVGADLGYALVGVVNLLDPQAIVIGGGVSASAAFFLPAVRAEINRRSLIPRDWLEILPAQLGNDAGRIGAARLALTQCLSAKN